MTPMQEGFYSLERNYKTLRWKLSVPIELDTGAVVVSTSHLRARIFPSAVAH